jgi:hypothetical protein
MRRQAGLLLCERDSKVTIVKPHTNATALKAERERDKAQAIREYEAEKHAWQANMMRLRALRLARENAAAQTTPVHRPITKKPPIRKVAS